MFEDADNLADLFRGGLPYYILIALPFLIICSSNPVLASSEFNVQRMSQYDLHGVPYGEYKIDSGQKAAHIFIHFLFVFRMVGRYAIPSKRNNSEVK